MGIKIPWSEKTDAVRRLRAHYGYSGWMNQRRRAKSRAKSGVSEAVKTGVEINEVDVAGLTDKAKVKMRGLGVKAGFGHGKMRELPARKAIQASLYNMTLYRRAGSRRRLARRMMMIRLAPGATAIPQEEHCTEWPMPFSLAQGSHRRHGIAKPILSFFHPFLGFDHDNARGIHFVSKFTAAGVAFFESGASSTGPLGVSSGCSCACHCLETRPSRQAGLMG